MIRLHIFFTCKKWRLLIGLRPILFYFFVFVFSFFPKYFHSFKLFDSFQIFSSFHLLNLFFFFFFLFCFLLFFSFLFFSILFLLFSSLLLLLFSFLFLFYYFLHFKQISGLIIIVIEVYLGRRKNGYKRIKELWQGSKVVM